MKKMHALAFISIFFMLIAPGEQTWAATDESVSTAIKEDVQSPSQSEKILIKPGQPLTINTSAQDLQPTDDVNLAREQALTFPDSPEASFILAVALTRTSRVEEALQEVRHARRLADAQGGATYFDKMIKAYEEMLKNYPDENRVRYGLAWAYYMKAYLLSQQSKKSAAVNSVVANPASANPIAAGAAQAATTPDQAANNDFSKKAQHKKVDADAARTILSAVNPALAAKLPQDQRKIAATSLPHIPGAVENASPDVVPQVKAFYALALKNLDDLLARKPDDAWAYAYRWHLYAEDSGDVSTSISRWQEGEKKFPNNPAIQFFLGNGYLKQGNLKEALKHVTRALVLRGLGN